MNPPLYASDLLALVHRYYPAHIESQDPRYDASEEARRRRALCEVARQDDSAWRGFLGRVREELPDCRLWELPLLLYHPCRCLRVALPDSPTSADVQKAVVLLVSIIAPAHLLYASRQVYADGRVAESWTCYPPLPNEFQPIERTLDTLGASVLRTQRLPDSVLSVPVPDIQIGHLEIGHARLIDCLFTDDRW